MMRIETSTGKVFPIRVMCEALRNRNQVLIEFQDDRPLHEIAEEFDGLSFIRRYYAEESTVYEMYEGFSKLVSVKRNADGTVRLMLEKDVNSNA